MPSRNVQIRRRLQLERERDAKLRTEVRTKPRVQVKRSKCLLEKTIEAVQCQIFSFLTAREHWNLSMGSHKLKIISRSLQASPAKIDLLLNMDPKIVLHLLGFRPASLTLPFAAAETTKPPQLSILNQLRELTFTNAGDLVFQERRYHNIGWVSRLADLTKLTKLKIPYGYLEDFHLTRFPSSLTHLHIPGISKDSFCNISRFILFQLSDSSNLSRLQVLKLPRNLYYSIEILDIASKLPLLRELGIGYFEQTKNMGRTSFAPLQACEHLESLTVGVDCNETITQWETLAQLSSLRRLTIIIFHNWALPSTVFTGLDKVNQLTHLQLVRYSDNFTTNISAATLELTDSTNSSGSILPKLTTLIIDDGFELSDADSLSIFTSLTELQLPISTIIFPSLPKLHTLHTTTGRVLRHYADQLHTVVYKRISLNALTSDILQVLTTMKRLAILKLDLRSTLLDKDNHDCPLSTLIRSCVLPTLRIEIDSSMEDELRGLT